MEGSLNHLEAMLETIIERGIMILGFFFLGGAELRNHPQYGCRFAFVFRRVPTGGHLS